MEALLAEVQALRTEVQQLRAQPMQEDEGDVNGGEGDADLDLPDWLDILPQNKKAPEKEAAVALVALVGPPPPLDALKLAGENQIKYQGVPVTPPARRHRMDTNFMLLQQKMENAMHALVGSQETENRQQVAEAAAWVRSAWQDIHEHRRRMLAGRQSWKLEKRPDDTRTRLLTKEEEEKIAKGKRPQQPQARRQFWGETQHWNQGNPSQSSNPFPKKGKGQGKGKGKGKGAL